MDVEKVAKGLTKAQREAILSMPDKNLDRWNRRVRYPTGLVLAIMYLSEQ